MKRIAFALAVLGLVALGVWAVWPNGQSPVGAPAETSLGISSGTPSVQPSPSAAYTEDPTESWPTASASPGASPSPVEAETSAAPKLTAVMPTIAEVRREAKRNVHQTPPSLIRFSNTVAARIERARANPSERQGLFNELRACAETATVAVTQRYCFASARELVETKFPELRTDANLKWIAASVEKFSPN